MSADQIAVIDVETTGLSPWRHDRIVEIAVVLISPEGVTLAEYESLVNPDRDLGPTRIHQITAAEALHAPKFADIAGDVLELLTNATVVAGHNVSFDKNFLVSEYKRFGVSIPKIPLLCTCRLFGRSNLQACCEELAIAFDGLPHRAITDARATAGIVSLLCSDDASILDCYRLTGVQWPSLEALRTPKYCREHAAAEKNEPPKFLQRLAGKMRHDTEAVDQDILAYLTLVDRILEDRMIDDDEAVTLADAALNWKMSSAQIETAHTQYLHNLAALAWVDGVVTEAERRDLETVARLLGQDATQVDAIIASAASKLASADRARAEGPKDTSLCGQRVCFTGELSATIDGQPVTREIAEAVAAKAGLVVVGSVTKKLDVLVVADPNTQSGKAKKARQYGIRILSEPVFWRMAGVVVD